MKIRLQHGFSLLELMISLAILSIVTGVIVEGINTMQARNTVETNKLDLTQQTREFMDQIVNDLDQAGYPSLGMFDPSQLIAPPAGTPVCRVNPNLACGFISVSATDIQFEGDVDGSGVSEEWIQLRQTNGANAALCTAPPCVIQRGTVSKALWNNGAGTPAIYFTEVSGVMNTTVFTPYDNNGSLVGPLPATQANAELHNISAIGITLFVRSSQTDPKTGLFPTVTMVSTAKVTNTQN
ncbi:MAG TPA: prepilin-type N-terminal cleavage/methylation domain-containing protein [Candidatus Acidoferrales bacterium]